MRAILRVSMSVMLVAALLFPRQAAAVSHTFCFKYGTTGFADRSTGDFLVGSTFGAYGTKFTIIRNSTGASYSWYAGTNGCKTVNLAYDSWTVRVFRTAQVNGSTIAVRNSGGVLYYSQVESAFVPTDGGTTTWTSSGNVPQIMAAATFANASHNGGLSGETLTFRTSLAACPENAAGCYYHLADTIYIGSVLADYKFGIIHEMGHAKTSHANPEGKDLLDCSKNNVDCPGQGDHSMASKEYQSCAAVEGVANGYAALAFNDENESDCDFEKHYEVDWNGDGDTVDPGEGTVFSCEGGTTTTNPDVPDEDYLGAFCLASGPTDNRATEYDWLRAVWDLSTDDGVSFATFLDVWNRANPHNWNASGNGTGGAYPANRMAAAAGLEGIGPTWANNAEDNGIDR